MPSEATLAGFRSAVSILFKPGESAVSVFAEYEGASASVIWLDDVQDPTKLPPYWFLSVPGGWYDPDMGNLEVHGFQHPKKIHQCVGGKITGEVDIAGRPTVQFDTEVEVYTAKSSPFIVFEVDYLYFTKDQKATPELKKLQREAMAYAFRAAGFPFAVLTDSGGKSIHATVRLDDDLATIQAWRQSPEFDRLQDLAWVVFGDFDRAILRESGRARLVRTPGATREDGSPQTILATGQRVSIHDLTKWFYEQLSPETQQEVASRIPIMERLSLSRTHYLRIDKWRKELLRAHNEGERGTHWFHISKSLMVAGCREPRLLVKPNAQAPCGQWQASWLWHVSAYTFNAFSNGWFFSQNSTDWSSPGERTRWDGESGRRGYVNEQLKFEGATDPSKNALVDQMMAVQQAAAAAQAEQLITGLPLPPSVGPPVHVGGVTGATLQTGIVPPKPPKDKKSFEGYIAALEEKVPRGTLIKLSESQGSCWMYFYRSIWVTLPNDFAKAFIASKVLPKGSPNSLVHEVYSTMEREYIINEPWVEYPNAIAFLNGTLYIDSDGVEFRAEHDPDDRLRSLVPCHYDPQAQCPRWENFIRWALPDPSRLSLLQEAFGYTLIPGQPFQSFFMMTGTGSNGKSVVLAVLQALHKDSFETVALANLGGRFSLGTLGRKRLAIDTEAENVVNAVSGEGNSATAILKSWTGGDPVKVERKSVQGWSETINAKYFMSCNKKPRFVDPTKGVWRRLKLLKFEASIDERQADVTLGSKLVNQELPGIVNWAVNGLRRLYAQNGFTQSDSLRGDLAEYQIDSDSVALFVQDFMRLAVGDSAQAWFDIRPFHKAYKDRCLEAGNSPVSETEFRQRLEMLNVVVGRPGEHESVNGCPAGFERAPGLQHWSIRGWRCYHPAYTTQSLVGSYTTAQNIQAAPQQMQGAR